MQLQNEISVENFRAISSFAADAGGEKVRSFQNDRWLISTGPTAYQSIYDPSLGRLATSWREVRPGVIMFYGQARADRSLSFPIRASQDILGAFVGSNVGRPAAGAPIADRGRTPQPVLFPSVLGPGSEGRLAITAGAPSFFFGLFGIEEALDAEFAMIRRLCHASGDGAAPDRGIGVEREVLSMILQMLRNPFQGPALEAYLLGKALEIISFCCHAAENSGCPTRAELKKTPVSFICRELTRIPGEELTLSDFARYLDIAERTLSRRFREETGMTFSAYQRMRRMELAAQLLATGSGTTMQVCTEVGYHAITAFFRAFRDQHGMTPDEYRRICLH